jgi:NAD(P)-dependent dehydrogenase (short-subunit alcohol dehydrogenase family)
MRQGTIAVITGASSGIGAATAEAFAARGCRLVLGARRAGALDEVRERVMRRYGVEAVAMRCDVRDADDVCRLANAAVERFGGIDVFVNNAGVGFYGRVEDTAPDDFRDLIETNLLGVHHGVRAAVPVMRRQRRGHLVIVGSVVGKRGWAMHGAYAATKFALTGLAQTLRAELAGSGVTVSLILPGSTRTPFFDAARVVSPGYRPRPMGFVRSPEEVARRIVRSVDHPTPEVHTIPFIRPALVLAEAFPAIADIAAKWYYRSVMRGISRTSRSSAEADDTASTTGGTA